MKVVAVIVAVAALALGQGRMEAPLPGRFEVVLPGRGGDGFPPTSHMTVLLRDTTGLVRAMFAGGRSVRGKPISAVPGRTDAVVVDWASGRCDDHTILTLRPAADGYELTAAVASTLFHSGGGCSFLDAIPRSVTLHLSSRIDADSMRFLQVRN